MRKSIRLSVSTCNSVIFSMILASAIVIGLPSDGDLAPLASQLGQEFHSIAEATGPAVVSITTVHIIEARGLGPLERFFEQQLPEGYRFEAPEREFRRHGLGSGVIVSEDGLILTNSHVVAEAERLTVTLQDGREFAAEIVGVDPPSDIAVLQIDGENLPTVAMGNSDTVATGDFVLAIGNPFGLAHTVTIGNISAKGRADVGIAEYEDFIQIDAAINPGNSGGPLVAVSGEVIGINTAILSGTGGSQGIGFAVPSNMAEAVMQSIIEDGKVVRGWLGVSIQDVTPRLAEALDVEHDQGALIGAVVPQSPAAEAGFERGDIVTRIEEMKIENSRDLRRQVAALDPGSAVTATIIRNGESMELPFTVGERPLEDPEPQVEDEDVRLTIQVRELTEQVRRHLNLEAETGVLIVEVDPASAAYAEGIRPGMVIKEVNRQTIGSVREFNQAMEAAMDQDRVLFLISFRGRSIYLTVPVD